MLHLLNTLRLPSLPSRLSLAFISAVSLFSLNTHADSTSSQKQLSGYDQVWDSLNLYKDDNGNYFRIAGRVHLDAAYFKADQGEFDDLTFRRSRLGWKSKYGKFTTGFEVNLDFNSSADKKYTRITDAYIKWAVTGNTDLKFLKQGIGFTLDGNTSSKKLKTAQRNNLSNNLWFTKEYYTGVSISGDLTPDLEYKAGMYSSDSSDEIGFTEASYFTLMSVDKQFGKNALWDKAEIGFDYVYNDNHVDSSTRDFSNIISMTSKMHFGEWQVWTDISAGKGDFTGKDDKKQSDVWGAVIMPSYQISKNLEYVIRYTYIDSKDPNGVRLMKYENKVIKERGENYHELYTGGSYFLYSHKLKLQLGVQYTTMDGNENGKGEYDGWGVTSTLRTYW